MKKQQPVIHILFLDGDCLFCQRSARFLHRWDRTDSIHFSTLQGKTANRLPDDWRKLIDQQGHPTGTAVLIENSGQPEERLWKSADAILRSLRLTGSIFGLAWVFYYLPPGIKNRIYQITARNRHRFTSKKNNCPLPEQDFKDKYLP